MRLFVEEARKVLKRRTILVGVVLLLALDIYNIVANEADTDYPADIGYWQIYGHIEGTMTNENISFVMSNYERLSALVASGEFEAEAPSGEFYTGYAFGDWVVFDKHRQEMERIFLYNSTIQALRSSAEENIAFYESVGNGYESKRSGLVAATYGTRILDHYYEMSGIHKYLSYDFSSLLIMFLLVLVACPVFAHERESGTDQVTMAAIKGRHRTALAKKHAVMSIALTLCLIFSLSDLVCFSIVSHLNGWTAPVYQVKQFGFSPLTMSVWQFAFVSFLLKCLGCAIISQIILFFSSLLKNTVAAFALSVLLFLLCVGLYGQSAFDLANPVSFLYSRDFLAAPSFANIHGMPVGRFQLVILAGIIEVSVVYAAVHLAYVRGVSVAGKKGSSTPKPLGYQEELGSEGGK